MTQPNRTPAPLPTLDMDTLKKAYTANQTKQAMSMLDSRQMTLAEKLVELMQTLGKLGKRLDSIETRLENLENPNE